MKIMDILCLRVISWKYEKMVDSKSYNHDLQV